MKMATSSVAAEPPIRAVSFPFLFVLAACLASFCMRIEISVEILFPFPSPPLLVIVANRQLVGFVACLTSLVLVSDDDSCVCVLKWCRMC